MKTTLYPGKDHYVRTIILLFITSLTAGCGFLPRTGTPSEALQVADAIGVPANDMPRSTYAQITARRGATSTGKNLDNTVSGAAHLIGSGDPTMLLLSGLTPRSISANIQIVAWVPEEVASSPQQAVDISKRSYLEASASAHAKTEEDRQKMLGYKVRYVLGQPYGEGGPVHAYAQLADLIADHSPTLSTPPSFIRSPNRVYGPIFIGAWGGHAKAEDVQTTLRMSSLLPPWFYIYSPGLTGVAPPSIMNQGRQLLFVEP